MYQKDCLPILANLTDLKVMSFVNVEQGSILCSYYIRDTIRTVLLQANGKVVNWKKCRVITHAKVWPMLVRMTQMQMCLKAMKFIFAAATWGTFS